MDQAEAKIHFDAGALSEARITAAPMQKGWLAEIKQKKGPGYVGIQKQRGGVRVYKSLDAANATLVAIGFKKVVVHEA